MKKAWWPSNVYEAWPWIAMATGATAASLAFWSTLRSRGEWSFAGVLVFLAGCTLFVYGGYVLQLRRDYRKRSKWHRENS